MKRLALLLSISSVVLAACTPVSSDNIPTDYTGLCFAGGPIYTAIDDTPIVEAVAVKGGEITYAGSIGNSSDWCEPNAGGNPNKIDLAGKALFPGFTDAHAHLLGIGLREMTLNLEGTASIEDLKTRLRDAVANTNTGETIYGRGWIETHWPEGRFPSRADLDDASPNNPVIFERADGHAVVVNTAALKAAGITAETTPPFGGDITKDENGEPTGMLIDMAIELVGDLMPKLTLDRKTKAFEVGSELYAKRGWTNIHGMSVDPANIPIMKSLSNSGKLPIRVYNSVDITNGFDDAYFDIDTSGLVTTRAIKLFSDGALGSRGAALLSPYDDDPEKSGLMLTTYDDIMPVLKKALESGVQINTHAIGDKANHEVLNWYEEAYASISEEDRAVTDPRWRIEHSQIIALNDIPRFNELGIIPSMQPSHAIGDLHFAVDRIGPERLAGGYAWRSLIDSGSIIAGGSDAPVEVGDPRIEFYAAVARKDLKGFSNENWYPGQAVSRQEALKMFTIWPAYAAFEEDKLGTIETGKRADFTVFDQDIMAIDAPDILKANVTMTIVDGQVVYSAE